MGAGRDGDEGLIVLQQAALPKRRVLRRESNLETTPPPAAACTDLLPVVEESRQLQPNVYLAGEKGQRPGNRRPTKLS